MTGYVFGVLSKVAKESFWVLFGQKLIKPSEDNLQVFLEVLVDKSAVLTGLNDYLVINLGHLGVAEVGLQVDAVVESLDCENLVEQSRCLILANVRPNWIPYSIELVLVAPFLLKRLTLLHHESEQV